MELKLIAISDLHQGNPVSLPSGIEVIKQEKLIDNLLKRNPKAILLSGDLQDYSWILGTDQSALVQIKKLIQDDSVFNLLNTNTDIPVYYIWGNSDIMDSEKENEDNTPLTDELRRWFDENFANFINCHATIKYLEDIPIIGYNDANKTLGNPSGKCWDDPDLERDLTPKIDELSSTERRKAILLTHTPPRGILDFSSFADHHIGSYHLRKIIDDYQPLLSIFGHVHYCGGYHNYVGRTQCLNVSSYGLAVSHNILFGQSAFEIAINSKRKLEKTSMIVSYYQEGSKRYPFVEYRKCLVCSRFAPFARPQFKVCRICLSTRRIENRLKEDENSREE
ncbi:metallophosphoesterase family protein [Candidatus Hodarchaeum mangrovi]